MKELAGVIILMVTLSLTSCVSMSKTTSERKIPERGVTSSVPAKRWDYGFLTGNGRIGTVVYGEPTKTMVAFNHERLYLPQRHPQIPDLGKTFPEVRRIIREKGHNAAKAFSMQQAAKQKHFNFHSDPFHLAFELKLEMLGKGMVTNYLRTTDFQTGEVSTHWSDDEGKYVQKIFVSRSDNIALLSIKRPNAKPLQLTITATPITHKLIDSELNVNKEWITYCNAYKESQGGYDNVIRLITKGGNVKVDDGKLVVTDTDEVLLVTKIERYEKLKEGSVDVLKKSLRDLPKDYNKLLKPHVAQHSEIFNRVRLDLGGGEDHRLTSEELLKMAKASGYKKVPVALLEKLYDASRFYFICSAGETPPNLQGIWNGVFTAPWNGTYTYDTNVQNAIDSALSGNMKEGMDGFFRMIESHVPDWRINAQKLFGCRGVAAPIVGSPTTGLNLHFGGHWPAQFWTGGAGWLVSYFYDYYRFTGDKEFLAKRVVPLMKEVALFYEDFLIEKDASGHYIYRPSSSPEYGMVTMSDNSTFDIAIAKELLTNLIAACEELEIEQENIGKWQAILKNMPPYQIGPNGDLPEWSDGTFRHFYNHRHYSPFYPIFRSFEFSPETTPKLWEVAKVTLEKKKKQRSRSGDWKGIPFGRVFHAQSAAYLGQGNEVEEILNSMTDRVYPSLHMSLKTNGGIFNFDGNGAYPDIINRSLAFSLNGTLDLLRSVPPGWSKGSIRGILARGQIKINHLQWDQTTGVIQLELISGIDQEITLRLPGAKTLDVLKVIKGSVKIKESSQGTNARQVILPSKKKVKLEIRYTSKIYSEKNNARFCLLK